MIEPTETESKENLDEFIKACKNVAEEANSSPDLLRNAPALSKSARLDETKAARNPCLTG
jgi:glycine dehydrogenase subunit 2